MTMHFAPPGAQARASALLRTVPMSLWPQAVLDRRARLEAGLERLADLREEMIARLDAIDGDCDLEDGGDLEPSICGYQGFTDLELDKADDEPSLGWPLGMSQLRLDRGASDEREGEHDGREPDCDAEPEDFV